MRFAKLSLFIAGTVGILILAVPRAAHAVVATLVQVANPASSPVVTQGIGQQAAQIVEVECGYLALSQIQFGCAGVPPAGFVADYPAPNSQYTVPAGQTLVVTAVDILSGSAAGSPCTASALASMFTLVPVSPGSQDLVRRKAWIVPAGTGTAHYVYPSGILFASGTSLDSVTNQTTTCTLTLDMHGYLTAQ
jgi:hypothetical protein